MKQKHHKNWERQHKTIPDKQEKWPLGVISILPTIKKVLLYRDFALFNTLHDSHICLIMISVQVQNKKQ